MDPSRYAALKEEARRRAMELRAKTPPEDLPKNPLPLQPNALRQHKRLLLALLRQSAATRPLSLQPLFLAQLLPRMQLVTAISPLPTWQSRQVLGSWSSSPTPASGRTTCRGGH